MMDQRPFPSNIEAEQSILSTVLVEPDTIGDIMNIISAKDFYDLRHRLIFAAVMDMYREGRPIDPVTAADHMKTYIKDAGGMSYIVELFKSGVPTDIVEYARILKECTDKRKIIKIASDMYKSAMEETKKSGEIISGAADDLFDITHKGEKDLEEFGYSLESAIDIVGEARKNGGRITGILTGYSELDEYINGLNKGDFIIIAGRSSMGKTALALNIAARVSKQHSTAIFSLEMQKAQLALRMVSFDSRIRLENLKKGKLSDDSEEKMLRSASKLAAHKIMVDDTSALTMADIKAKCRKMKMKKGLDVVVVDYIGLIESGQRAENRQQEISKISRQLKNMAMDLGITVIALSQLNRAPEARQSKRPQLADLRESGAIEQDADVVILLYREDYYNPDTTEKGVAELIIAKNRNGPVGSVKLGWMGEFQRFKELGEA